VLTLETDPEEAATRGWTRAVSGNYLDLRIDGSWPANRWIDVEIAFNEGARTIARPACRQLAPG
jgi:hypothetical protein